ncbi:excitatory amino acid transporter 3-like [Ptychodera flava]|uniref:excitatory amino acid transporter 3-like n=1 Tax=Ptychodera flava TaxID=63121 RepID=UPI00396A2C47
MARMNCSKGCWKSVIKNNLLFILTMIGVVVGFVLVFIIRPFKPSNDAIMWIGMPGELFMRGLYCMVIPVLTSSVITATASIEPKTNGKMSGISFAFMFTVVFFGVVVGTVLTLAIKPGKVEIGNDDDDFKTAHYETQDVIADLLRNLIPNNLVKACVQTAYTAYTFGTVDPPDDSKNLDPLTNDSLSANSSYSVSGNNTGINATTSPSKDAITIVTSKSLEYGSGTNLLGLLVFSALFGVVMCMEKQSCAVMLQFMSSLRLISTKILTYYLWLLPIGTPSLICKSMLPVDDLIAVWKSLGLFSADVIVGLCIHEFITLSAIYYIFTRKNPYLMIFRSSRAILMSMITKTNAATMPMIFRVCIVNNKMNKKITHYAVPLNVGMKSDGSALFIVSGALYLAQTSNMSMNFGHVITMAIVSWVMGLCLPAVPSASLVAIVTVASAVGASTENIGLLVSMEWLLDSLRTGVNCTSHCVGAGLVNSIMADEIEADVENEYNEEKDEIPEQQKEDEKNSAADTEDKDKDKEEKDTFL